MEYKFIIDTDQYAGNFERDLCAYVTGHIGECRVGDDFAELYIQEVGDEVDDVIQKADEDGCYRPCEIEPNSNYFNTGMGCHYHISETDEAKILSDYAAAERGYWAGPIKSTEGVKARLLNGEKVLDWTVDACDKQIAEYNSKIEKAANAKTYQKHPAYLSVAIFFDERPSVEQIDLMKDRAGKFAAAKVAMGKSWDKDFKLNIEGFRLVKITKTEQEESV